MNKRKDWRGGERIRIKGTIAFPDEEGAPVHVGGETGEVIGSQATYEARDGERRVAVQLDADGSIVGVPEGALRNEGAFRRFIDAVRAGREAFRRE